MTNPDLPTVDPTDRRVAVAVAQAATRVAFRAREGHGGAPIIYRQLRAHELETIVAAACVEAIEQRRRLP